MQLGIGLLTSAITLSKLLCGTGPHLHQGLVAGPFAVRVLRRQSGCLLLSQEGMVIRFAIDEVRKTGRNALGVRLLNLASEADRVVGIAKIDAAAQAHLGHPVMLEDLAAPQRGERRTQAGGGVVGAGPSLAAGARLARGD